MEMISERDAEERARVARPGTGASLPGATLSVAIAIGSGLAFSAVGWSHLAAGEREEGAQSASVLAEVSTSELAGALSTMDISSRARARLMEKTSCRPHLAWVSVAGVPKQEGGKIRLQSGSYFSPLFTLGERPAKVAIPYPGPYESGHGALAVFMEAGGALVGLSPVWQVPASGGEIVRNVTWRPLRSCENTHG